MERVFEEKYLTIFRNDEERYFLQVWKGFADSKQFRTGIDVFMKHLDEARYGRIVINIEDQRAPFRDDMNYARDRINEFTSQKSGVKCAYVLPKSVILQVALRFFGNQLMGLKGIDLKFFNTQTEALGWVLE